MAYGNLTNLVDALNRTNRWTYDTNGRLTASIPALSTAQTTYYAYDAIGRLQASWKPGPLGVRRTNVYDNLDRIIGVVDSYGYTNRIRVTNPM